MQYNETKPKLSHVVSQLEEGKLRSKALRRRGETLGEALKQEVGTAFFTSLLFIE